MEPNTETAEVKKNLEYSDAVETPYEKVKIEDCSDDSDHIDGPTIVQLPIKYSKAEMKTEAKSEDIIEEVGLDSDEEEGESGSDVVETVKIMDKPEIAAVVEENNNERSTISSSDDKSVGVETASSTLITMKTAVTDVNLVASSEVAEQQQAKEEKENVIDEENEEEDINSGEEAHLGVEAKEEQVTTDPGTTELKVKLNENAATMRKVVLCAAQPLIDDTQLNQQQPQHVQGESSNATKHIDLHKIFTPATDAEEILPRNRKLYSSSAFYSPALHPTVEDQVELARRISHSLSDISNQKSKGQSMYVNRKKRSVKWVHEGAGQALCGKRSILRGILKNPAIKSTILRYGREVIFHLYGALISLIVTADRGLRLRR
ncbi:uncharacterized protein LOC128869321 isoform X4 [Anastrepha ludens]|uniref:uncharacterized protein LOC128869321 isoform X4 n=1 Tax=Anastrepha ludens TaxID=28586 RepID=UPI0023AF12F8|nr:uncharacterized protein LOC128869321 isoform X4 [Anastrepha ludens]